MNQPPTKPWRVERTSVYGANDQLVCTVGSFTKESDSALIAAAPLLLVAMRDILSLYTDLRGASIDTTIDTALARFNRARAAVALAEGR